jgi:hypothetical protein
MGQITIEIPQKVNRKYRLVSKSSAKEVMSQIETLVKNENQVDDNEILGLWADREESVKEISRALRRKSNDCTAKNLSNI